MNTTTTLSIVLRHLVPALQSIQQDILDAERDVDALEPSPRQNPPIQQAITASKKLFNTKEAAEYLGLSQGSIYQMTSGRRIPFFKIGSRILFKEEQLLNWLASHEHTPDDMIRRSTRRN